MIIACLLLWAWNFTGVPKDTDSFLSSVRYSLGAAANFFFKDNTGGYFDTNSNDMPLLHFWSLAVEEQFYLIWPLLLLLTYGGFKRLNKYRKKPLSFDFFILSLLSTLSFIGSVIAMHRGDQKFAFYEMQWRIWEFGLGGLVGFWSPAYVAKLKRLPLKTRQTWSELVPFLGLGLLVFSIVFYDVHMGFPGVLALPPALGAALVILGGETDFKNRVSSLLSTGPLVFLGLLSYGWYLWHWPFLVFLRLNEAGETPSLKLRIAAVIASAVAAFFSRKFVESPLRYSRRLKALPSLVVLSGGFLIMLTLAFSTQLVKSYDDFVTQKKWADMVTMTSARSKAADDCDGRFEKIGTATCMRPIDFRADAQSSTIAVWGNSHGGAIFPMVEKYIAGKNVQSLLYFVGGVPGLIYPPNFSYLGEKGTQRSLKFNSMIFDDISKRIKDSPGQKFSVILADRWMQVAATKTISVDDEILFIENTHEHQKTLDMFESSLHETLKALNQAGVYRMLIMLPYPEFKYEALRCYVRDLPNCATPRKTMEDYRTEIVAMILRVSAEFPNVRIFDPMRALCGPEICPEFMNVHGKVIPVVFDASHPSVAASEYLEEAERGDLDWLVQ